MVMTSEPLLYRFLGTKEQYTATKFDTIIQETGPNKPFSFGIDNA
jgi:hypothetical protein